MKPENQKLQSVIEGLLTPRLPFRVLEAGCGSTSHLPLNPQWQLTGIDLSERQLSKNTHLHEKIVGNLETYRWDSSRFEMIVCWDVIEHLPNPQDALKNLFDALAPGGLLVLAFPHLNSIKGWVTKLTPFWVHLAFYRYLIGDKRPTSEMGQFPTYLRRDILPQRVIDLAVQYGLECVYRLEYEAWVQRHLRQRNRLANLFFTLTAFLNLNDSDCMLVLRRPAK
jgi:SAM-dependent methyltransferase